MELNSATVLYALPVNPPYSYYLLDEAQNVCFTFFFLIISWPFFLGILILEGVERPVG